MGCGNHWIHFSTVPNTYASHCTMKDMLRISEIDKDQSEQDKTRGELVQLCSFALEKDKL